MENYKTNDLHYTVTGTGDSLVLLHGFLGSSSIWEAFITHFKKNFSVIAIDLPGHGKSPVDREEITMSFCAEKVSAILREEGVETAHFIGHSMGGYVALACAELYPQQINTLTLFNSTAKADTSLKQADRLKAVRIFDMNPSIFIDEAIKSLFYAPNLKKYPEAVIELTKIAKQTLVKGAQASLRGMRLRKDMVDWLSEQKFPIHYIAGKQDNTIPFASILEQIATTNAYLTSFEHSGHIGFVENEKASIEAIEEFISN